jgi:hypothetical protein
LDENIVQVEQARLIRQGGILHKFFTQAEKPKELITALLEVLNYVLNNISRQKQLKNIEAELL